MSIRVISNHLSHSKNSITCYFVNPITFFIKITYLFLKPILKLFLTFTSPYRVSSKEHQRHLFKRGALIKSLCFPVEQFHQPCSFVLTYFTYYTFQRCQRANLGKPISATCPAWRPALLLNSNAYPGLHLRRRGSGSGGLPQIRFPRA